MCAQKNLEGNRSLPSRVLPGHHHLNLAGSVADEAVGVIQRDSAAAFVWISLHIPSDYRHLSGVVPAENEQTPDIFKAQRSNDEALAEISFLVSVSSIPQNLSFQVRGGGAVMAHVRCKHAMRYYYHRGDQGRRLPPVLWGEESNVSGH